jgi:hypothetical protein
MSPNDAVPVFFEIDEENENHANGTVHPFCSISCRNAAFYAIAEDVLAAGFCIVTGESTDIDYQAVCEHCLRPIYGG